MICDNLVLLRRLRGLSQEQVAEGVGISRQAYGKWEKGETIPDIEKCDLLARFYGVSIDSLVHTEELEHHAAVPPAPKGKHIFGTVAVSNRGQLVIPKAARELFGIADGDRLVVLGDEEEGIALVKERVFMERINLAMALAAQTPPPHRPCPGAENTL